MPPFWQQQAFAQTTVYRLALACDKAKKCWSPLSDQHYSNNAAVFCSASQPPRESPSAVAD
jgi:hypothetical protein